MSKEIHSKPSRPPGRPLTPWLRLVDGETRQRQTVPTSITKDTNGV